LQKTMFSDSSRIVEWIPIEKSEFIYLSAVTLAALLFLAAFPLLLRRWENIKLQRIRKLKKFSSIKTHAPLNGQVKAAREAAVESVGGRFSIIRKIAAGVILLIWFILIAFPFIGMVPRTMISLVISAAGVIVGIAARPFIENVIAGIIISFSKLFKLGDTVHIDQQYGTIEDITMTHSVVKLWDWRRYIVPNSTMLNKEVINYSLYDSYFWAHVEFWVSWNADLEAVKAVSLDLAHDLMSKNAHENPRFWVMDMDKDSIKCWITAWTDSADDAWRYRAEMRTRLLTRLQGMGIKPNLTVLEWEKNGPSGGPLS